jgi:hypothetical protein
MLVPIYLGLSSAPHMAGHHPSGAVMNANLSLAVVVSVIHTLAMIGAGGTLAWLVYRYLGPKFVSQSWFNVDVLWAVSLILVGTISLAFNAVAID